MQLWRIVNGSGEPEGNVVSDRVCIECKSAEYVLAGIYVWGLSSVALTFATEGREYIVEMRDAELTL